MTILILMIIVFLLYGYYKLKFKNFSSNIELILLTPLYFLIFLVFETYLFSDEGNTLFGILGIVVLFTTLYLSLLQRK